VRFLLLVTAAACTGGSATVDGGGGGGSGNLPDADPAVVALEDEAFALILAERTAGSVGGLVHDDALRAVARAHSEDMVARSFFAHVNPDNEDPFDRMAAAGISFSTAGENIAWNLGYSDPAGTAVTGWMNSAGHRANILNGSFTHSGMGVAVAPDGGVYFTQVFTRPLGTLVLAGWLVAGDGVVAGDDEATSSWHARGQ